MERLLDLYGFVSVVLHMAELVAVSVVAGSAVFLALTAAPLARDRMEPDGARLVAITRRWVIGAALASVVTTGLGAALQAAALEASLQAPLVVLLGADFLHAAVATVLAALLLLALAVPAGIPAAWRRALLCAGALALVGAATIESHAVARLDDRGLLFLATLLHRAGAALWLGGLPPLLAALRLAPGLTRRAGRLYSRQAASGVALIVLGILGFWNGYLGEAEALYATSYGAMSATKGVMFALLLLLGAGNFLLLHRAATPDGPLLIRVRRFVECEIAIGIAVLAAAASLTSLPPAVDLTSDRASWQEIVARFTPEWPRLSSPDHADLAIPALQARLDAEWQRAQESPRPHAFQPGEGVLPPRNAQDIAWSEYNHHWSGIMVLLVGLAALLDASRRVALARHWPLLFLGLAGFILVRSDPEAWPLGEIGLLDSLRDPEVVQHKLAALLVLGFALSEWGVRLGRLGGGARFVFPAAMLAGGVLLLAHSHAIADQKEALLVELSHLPIGVLAVVGGCARFVELRGPDGMARVARWVWPVCLVLIAVILVLYRET
jgi:putative copper resistance protein D